MINAIITASVGFDVCEHREPVGTRVIEFGEDGLSPHEEITPKKVIIYNLFIHRVNYMKSYTISGHKTITKKLVRISFNEGNDHGIFFLMGSWSLSIA